MIALTLGTTAISAPNGSGRVLRFMSPNGPLPDVVRDKTYTRLAITLAEAQTRLESDRARRTKVAWLLTVDKAEVREARIALERYVASHRSKPGR